MNDNTIVEISGMVMLGVMGATAMIVDGDIGADIAIAVAAGIGVIMGHVYGSSKGGDGSAEEVQVNGNGA